MQPALTVETHPGFETLVLSIGGGWEPRDFIEVFETVERLYYALAPTVLQGRTFAADTARHRERRRRGRVDIDQEREFRPGNERLTVVSVNYNSPGSISFKGLAPTIKAIGGLLDGLIKLGTERIQRRQADAQAILETEHKALEVESKKVAVQGEKIDLVFRTLRQIEDQNIRLPDGVQEEIISGLGPILRVVQEGLLRASQSLPDRR
tara:strand:+ start:11773 stop:12396 length:624 start_codon:yes stop_codon:yes gene_type:complete